MTPPKAPPANTNCRERARRLAAGALVMLLAACATRMPAPVVDRSAPPPAPPAAAPAPATAPAPERDWRPQTHTVKRGDTLHAIALDYGLDYRDLASWNNIENVNLIRVGQVLRLRAPGDTGTADAGAPAGPGVTTAPLRTGPPVVAGDARPPASPSATPLIVPGQRNAETYKSQPKAVKEPYSEQALRDVQRTIAAAPPPAAVPQPPVAMPGPAPGAVPVPVPASEPTVVARTDPKPEVRSEPKPAPAADEDDDKIEWLWPATGKIVTGFSDTANLKGIDIAGKAGQPVIASAAGKVVYAGTGLRGYGKLVIVKHSNTFLSAYAHNKDLLVKEGQQVTRGQKIAEMGNTDSDEVKLHFEIRKLGKPVDPTKYLPPG
jgi:lipoprotein NlpD